MQEDLVTSGSMDCWLYHSGLNSGLRRDTLNQFRRAGASALLACRSLDEGLDIPDVDAAVLVASTQSVRQRIQRIGRVLRKHKDDKRSLVITLTVNGVADQGVISGDERIFTDVATIHNVPGSECMDTVRRLLR